MMKSIGELDVATLLHIAQYALGFKVWPLQHVLHYWVYTNAAQKKKKRENFSFVYQGRRLRKGDREWVCFVMFVVYSLTLTMSIRLFIHQLRIQQFFLEYHVGILIRDISLRPLIFGYIFLPIFTGLKLVVVVPQS